jgi:hypothetical protein
MFCVIPNYIHAISYNNQVIILDMHKDKYYFLKPEIISDIMLGLANEFTSLHEINSAKLSYKTSKNLNMLITLGIIRMEKARPLSHKPFLNEIKFSKGSTQLNWYMGNNSIQNKSNVSINFLILKSVCYFAYLTFKIKILSLHNAIRYVVNYSTKKASANSHNIEDVIRAVNKASLLFPLKSKCLLWSLVTTIMLRHNNITAQFNIGVQNMPFMAHAWVEVEDKIIADSHEIPKAMAVIFNSARDCL